MNCNTTHYRANSSSVPGDPTQGRIPGEGAAALLLADARQAALLGEEAHPLLFSAEAVREQSDQNKRNDTALLRGVADKVLQFGAVEAGKVGLVLADTGNATARVMELMGVSTEAMPHLDAASEVLRVGACAGSCGAVPYLTALALASQQATERQAAVLCLSNEDPCRRSAALIRPAAVLS